MQPPFQELVVRDLHDNTWTFRHIYRGKHTVELYKAQGMPLLYKYNLGIFEYSLFRAAEAAPSYNWLEYVRWSKAASSW